MVSVAAAAEAPPQLIVMSWEPELVIVSDVMGTGL